MIRVVFEAVLLIIHVLMGKQQELFRAKVHFYSYFIKAANIKVKN